MEVSFICSTIDLAKIYHRISLNAHLIKKKSFVSVQIFTVFVVQSIGPACTVGPPYTVGPAYAVGPAYTVGPDSGSSLYSRSTLLVHPIQ